MQFPFPALWISINIMSQRKYVKQMESALAQGQPSKTLSGSHHLNFEESVISGRGLSTFSIV